MAKEKERVRQPKNTQSPQESTMPLFQASSNQTQYLTVPNSGMARSGSGSDDLPTPPIEPTSMFCIKACGCIGVVFLFCVLTVFVYAVLITKYSTEPKMNNDIFFNGSPEHN